MSFSSSNCCCPGSFVTVQTDITADWSELFEEELFIIRLLDRAELELQVERVGVVGSLSGASLVLELSFGFEGSKLCIELELETAFNVPVLETFLRDGRAEELAAFSISFDIISLSCFSGKLDRSNGESEVSLEVGA